MTRLLVVEDSPTQALRLRMILESEGFDVEVASDGLQGLECVQASRFDLVITDIVMPGLTGYELCRRLKADPKSRHVPVMLLTTLNDPMNIIEGLDCGADNFVTKPYVPELLVQRIHSVLTNKSVRSEPRVRTGVDCVFLGKRFTITSGKEQMLDLLISTFEDIVRANGELERRVAERTAALQQSEERYRTLAESAEDQIFIVDRETCLEYVNVAQGKLFGVSPDVLVGRRLTDLFSADAWAPLRPILDNVFATATSTTDERSLPFADHERWMSTRLVPLRNEAGEVRSVLGVSRDETERRRLEQQFHQAQKLETIGQLAGGIAHDFNNLLTAILGYTGLLIEDLASSDRVTSKSRQDLQQVQKAGQRAAALTQQLLTFSRKQVVRPLVLDLNAVVADFETILRRLLREDIEFRALFASDLGRILVDAGQIDQVLMNLVVNSRDAMPDGGKLTIETANVELDEAYARDHISVIPGQYVMLAVSDTGCGMTQETQAKVFEPFFTTKSPGEGTGLGLATIYGIVKQSGGNIWVYSEPGHGTTFKIYWPWVDAPLEQARATGQVEEVRNGSETVLLVEDELAVRALARRVLEHHGYTVLEAPSGEEALRVAAQHIGPMHLLLTDVIMPAGNGRVLAQQLVALYPDLKVLYISGYTDDAIVHHGVLEAGVDFLQKPFTAKAVARMVREVLDKPRATRSSEQPH